MTARAKMRADYAENVRRSIRARDGKAPDRRALGRKERRVDWRATHAALVAACEDALASIDYCCGECTNGLTGTAMKLRAALALAGSDGGE